MISLCYKISSILALIVGNTAAAPFDQIDSHVQTCKCPDITFKVCGSDGETYKNLCQLECRLKKSPHFNVKFVKAGPCTGDDVSDCICKPEWKPICASNGLTYGSKCILDCERRRNPSLRIIKATACVLPYFIHWMRPMNSHQMEKARQQQQQANMKNNG